MSRPAAAGIWVGSALWSAASWVARRTQGPGKRLPARVISVGNLQAGGAGKTPLVARIAREGQDRGIPVCILTRGYRGEWERAGGTLAPGDVGDPAACGDEAALLRELAPAAWIGVGADRVARFEAVRAREPAFSRSESLVILDDGFQHFGIARDVEVVAITGRSRSQVLYRDFFGAAARADLLVWTKGERLPAKLAALSIPRVRVRYRLAPPLGAAAHLLVTGVADPDDVLRGARAAGWTIARHLYFPDHARYAEHALAEVLAEARAGGLRVLTTGKDAVKWKRLGLSDYSVLEPEIEIIEGEGAWNRVLWGS